MSITIRVPLKNRLSQLISQACHDEKAPVPFWHCNDDLLSPLSRDNHMMLPAIHPGAFIRERRLVMVNQKESPYVCHVFVCTNDRAGERKSCADNNSPIIRTTLKEAVSTRGWNKEVRVSQCGCMGLCGLGPNVLLYPQKIWFSGVSADDTDQIIAQIAAILQKNSA
jgi:(2Fe-2S) ferredoxin